MDTVFAPGTLANGRFRVMDMFHAKETQVYNISPIRHPVDRNFERDQFDEPVLHPLPNPEVPVADDLVPDVPVGVVPAENVEVPALPLAAAPVLVIQDAPEIHEHAAEALVLNGNEEPDDEGVNAAAPNENQNPMDPPVVRDARNEPKKKKHQPQPHPVEQHFEADAFDEPEFVAHPDPAVPIADLPGPDVPIEDAPLGDEPVEDVLVRNMEVAHLPLAAVLDPVIQDANQQALAPAEVMEIEDSGEQNNGEITEAVVPNEMQNPLVAPDDCDAKSLRGNKNKTKQDRKRKNDGKKNSPKRRMTSRKEQSTPNSEPSTSNTHVSQVNNTTAETPRLELVDLKNAIVDKVSQMAPKTKSLARLPQDLQDELSNIKTFNELYEKVHKFFLELLKVNRGRKTEEIYAKVTRKLRNLGLCCGKLQEYKATTMSCEGGNCDGIKANESYYGYKEEDGEEYCYCVTCFDADCMAATYLTLSEEKEVHKNRFEECCNVSIAEPLIECNACRNFTHEPCKALQEDSIMCKCNVKPIFDFDKLPTNMLTNFVEEALSQLNFIKLLKVRIVRNVTALAPIGKKMKSFLEKSKLPLPQQVQCKERKIVVYQQQGSVFVNFLSFSVKEYESGWIVLYYLDSVQHLELDDPKKRSAVYRKVLNAYLSYAENCGYQMAHVWADAPKKGVEFFFNERPENQHWCTQEQLEGFYKKMLEEGNRFYRIEYNFKKAKSFSKLYEVLQFSDFFMDCMEEYIGSMDGKKVTFKEFKSHLVKKAEDRDGALFYINLCADPFNGEINITDVDEEIKCDLAVSKEDWINFQFQNKLSFDTRRNAQFATIKTIEALNNTIELIEDTAE
ncbi:hypothetical protein GCK72_025880 [Caenorhabditis remanei]|uniref:histone acetyltransferase n=1 Tax=Caenorhabditis remanei TaxID=31234 RepID=A0A6A5G3Z2_CAERE|nr:hypothetical protein GCK72_025880 [Caenorhabditis remanei]KAF1749412.1 hypothetical protein GCK72_025880 [Caenorhabditis remanei]